ncbi:histidine kinase [Jatrophihabitans sp.]|uniref:sensor histidine kinase n=1 Tax=Jatrophihabitans sp. TaxID=1932789 RepID=UPI0030C6705A|nr:Histidine kinase [Jatrophihabitans sp.]
MPVGRPYPLPVVRPLVADVLLAIGVGVGVVLFDAFGTDYRSGAALAWDVALAAPLILRRRAPATAAAVLGALCLGQWTADVLATGDISVLIILYSLGVWERRRWLLASAVVVGDVGVVMAVTRWAPAGPDGNQWLSGLLATGTVTAAWVVGLYVRTRRAYLASMIERAETAERDRDRQAQIAVAEERTRMAREMHDVIAHSLAVMITLNDAAAAVTDEGPVRDTVTQASGVGRQALAEMQRLLGVLRSDGPTGLTPQPGTEQLADLIAIIRSAGLSVELAISGDPGQLAPTVQLAVYRIVQESLTNVLKHGRSVTRVVVTISYYEERVAVQIANDGEPSQLPSGVPFGHGLTGIRERVALYGGQFHAGPASGGGWHVDAVLKLRSAEVPVAG